MTAAVCWNDGYRYKSDALIRAPPSYTEHSRGFYADPDANKAPQFLDTALFPGKPCLYPAHPNRKPTGIIGSWGLGFAEGVGFRA